MTAAITITTVTPATDTLTATAHGLNTGDGFIAIYTANGTIPGGLAAVTDYWAIRVDANNVKLATSSTLAVAGTAIDITSAGSGTLQLLRGLPYRRPRIAAAAVQVASADDNDTWLALVAMWNLLTGQAQSLWSNITLAVSLIPGAGIAVPSGQNIVLTGTADLKHPSRSLMLPAVGPMSSGMTFNTTTLTAVNSAASGIWIPLPLKVGDRVLSVDFIRLGSATAYSENCSIQKIVGGVTTFPGNGGSVSTPASATWTTQNVAVTTPTAVAAGEQWFAVFQPNATPQALAGVSVNYDRP